MIINLSRIESSVLLLHMTITRKNIRNGFKKRYNANDAKELLNSFDEVKSTLELIIQDNDTNDDPDEIIRFDYNINEFNMLDAFLSWYVVDLEQLLDDSARLSNKNTLAEDKKQLETLKTVKKNVQKMKKLQLGEVSL